MRVLRGPGDLQVELEVGPDRVAALLHRRGHGVERAAHLPQVVGVAALRGQAGGLGLDADAQLEHGDHVAQRGELLRRQPERRRIAQADDEGADAVPRLHQARGLQLGDGLAHHGAADAELGHELGLGGQLVAGRQPAVADAVAQRFHQFQRQAARPAPQQFGRRFHACPPHKP